MSSSSTNLNNEIQDDYNSNKVNNEFNAKLNNSVAKYNLKFSWLNPTVATSLLVMLSLLIFIILIHLSVLQSHLALSQNNKSSTILSEVNDINSQIEELTSNPINSTDFKVAISNINTDLTDIQKSVTDVAKSSDVNKVSTQIETMKDDIDSRIENVNKIVSSNSGLKQYLEPSILPFQVISIDVLAEQPYASVNYQNHILPLAVGDTLAGWKVVDADYDLSEVNFENNKNELVKVKIQG